MSTNSRIFTTDGKSGTDGFQYVKTFGMTVKDRVDVTHPNMTQLTMIPPSSDTTVQNHKFILAKSLIGTGVGTAAALGLLSSSATVLTLTPNLTLDVARFYQFQAYVTLVLQTQNNQFYSGHYVISSAAKGPNLIGSNGGYRLDTITSDSGIDQFIPETGITLSILDNKFSISFTPSDDIEISTDVIVDIRINSSGFST